MVARCYYPWYDVFADLMVPREEIQEYYEDNPQDLLYGTTVYAAPCGGCGCVNESH